LNWKFYLNRKNNKKVKENSNTVSFGAWFGSKKSSKLHAPNIIRTLKRYDKISARTIFCVELFKISQNLENYNY